MVLSLQGSKSENPMRPAPLLMRLASPVNRVGISTLGNTPEAATGSPKTVCRPRQMGMVTA